ncbi:MAG: AraC family transcriptional regulator [Gemmatimonadota bacterium]|nr:AraC family transcriptional regulator [Gemmatimonadota bacterium]
MRRMAVPVTMGSPRFRTSATAGCTVTDAWFPPGAVLEPHTHDRTIFAVMLDGSFDSVIARRRLGCTPATVWTEPREERHANYIGRAGARVLVVQPDPARLDLFAPFASLTDEVHLLRHAGIAADARRVLAELDLDDALTPLAIDSLVLTMMTAASRLRLGGERRSVLPPWLARAQEMLHACFRDGVQLADVASAAGVHPSHLAHAFRRHFRTTVGAYARSLRLDWAIEQLSRTDAPLAEIALAAGYSDQSHFTRECRRVRGLSPGEYRRSRRS